MSVMVLMMAFLAERDEILRPVRASVLTGDDMVNLKMLMRAADLTRISVTAFHIELYVLVSELVSFLILLPLYRRILYPLDIEGSGLDNHP